MKTKTHPLRLAIDARNLTLERAAGEIKVSVTTLKRALGGKPIGAESRRLICAYFGRSSEELRLIEASSPGLSGTVLPENYRERLTETVMVKNAHLLEEGDRCFSFGKIATTEIILDGDGTAVYLPQHIRTHYIPVARELPSEFQVRKERIQQEQEEKKANGDPYQWNGERYNLTKFNISRDPMQEDMTLDLWFAPSDYYTFLATSMSLQEPEVREKYLADVEWDEAVPLFSHSFGTYLTVIASDGYTILVQRGKGMGCRPSTFDISLAEGLSRPLDRSTTSHAPDLYRCACRGLSEELGLHAPADFSVSDILLLSFAVDTEYCMWGLFGVVKLHKRIDEVLQNMKRGVRDKFESRKLFPIPFTPEDVSSFVFSHEPFTPGGLLCLYHALVHEFGRGVVDTVISSRL
jgi:hypothetical protein